MTRLALAGVGPLIIGADPARFGNDRFALAWRQGRKVRKIESKSKLDTVAGANWIKQVIDDDKPARVFVDVGGIGVDADQGYLGEHILTSATKKVDVAVFETAKAVQDTDGAADVLADGLDDLDDYYVSSLPATIAGLRIYVRSPAGRYQWDGWKLRLPPKDGDAPTVVELAPQIQSPDVLVAAAQRPGHLGHAGVDGRRTPRRARARRARRAGHRSAARQPLQCD